MITLFQGLPNARQHPWQLTRQQGAIPENTTLLLPALAAAVTGSALLLCACCTACPMLRASLREPWMPTSCSCLPLIQSLHCTPWLCTPASRHPDLLETTGRASHILLHPFLQGLLLLPPPPPPRPVMHPLLVEVAATEAPITDGGRQG